MRRSPRRARLLWSAVKAMARLGFCKTCQGRVSSEAASCPHCGQPAPYQDVPEQVRLLALRGQQIEAIKKLRDLTGLDLKDAKEMVDALRKS